MSRAPGWTSAASAAFFERRLHRFYPAIHAAFLKHRVSFSRGTENLKLRLAKRSSMAGSLAICHHDPPEPPAIGDRSAKSRSVSSTNDRTGILLDFSRIMPPLVKHYEFTLIIRVAALGKPLKGRIVCNAKITTSP
jgi:hypothetical protein